MLASETQCDPRQDAGDSSIDLQVPLQHFLREFIDNLPHSGRIELKELFRALAAHPERTAEIQSRYYQMHLTLWSALLAGDHAQLQRVAEPDPKDHRFDSPEWRTLAWFDYLKRAYLLNARWLTELLDTADLPADRKRRAAFVLRQCLDALSPTNFPASNPEVIRLAAQTRGHSLAEGLKNLRADLDRGHIQMSDEAAFEVGRNIAITPGAVVYENPIAQLIQYVPRTAQVYHRPLLIIPPFINKYYILDLQPENSFVRYALDQGFQVFMVSWRNVQEELGHCSWEDYIRQGIYEPLEAVQEITGADSSNVLGFCVGGTLLASALAVMQEPQRVASLTLLSAMLDFSDVGEIGVYVDEASVRQAEAMHRDGGIMPGRLLASSFASLRANELVWYFVINNYLKGELPRAFDLLFWNSDSANLPGRLYAWYLRNMYLENNLRVPGKIRLFGRRVDLNAVRCPAFVLAARDDHIVPWHSAYASTALLAGKIEFVLAASGHIAGVVNAPGARRRNYWVNDATPPSPDDWLSKAQSMAGSWWPRWSAWLEPQSGTSIQAPRQTGSQRHPRLEPAPGSYVRVASR